MNERYFNVVLIGDTGTYVRQLGTVNGEMFNAEAVEQAVVKQLNEGGVMISSVGVTHWTEFKSKSDFEQFISKSS